MFILHCQNHGCWTLSPAMLPAQNERQGISSLIETADGLALMLCQSRIYTNVMVHTKIFQWNLLTFPWPFKTFLHSNEELSWKKSNKMHPDLPSFFGAMSFICFTMTNLWIKHMWKACKIFANILIATHLKIIVRRHRIYIKYENYPTSWNWYFSMTSTDCQ